LGTIGTLLRSNRAFIGLLLCLGLLRTAVADYNPVPSSSMHPTILEGDVVLVNRLAYNVKVPLTDIVLARTGDPQRGDIVTFSSPKDGTRLIKRVAGLPGDIIAMRDRQLFVNGRAVDTPLPGISAEEVVGGRRVAALRVREELGGRPHVVQWLPGEASLSSFGPITIPPDRFLMLGDNRDNSADSRYIGLVPRELLIGRASRLLVSAAILGNWHPRFERFGRSLYD
jgi:signal peptidase I